MQMYSREETKRFLADRVARPASAGVIVENSQGEALLLKAHYKPYWSFPGGWIENNQTPLEAALRELEEEAGIKLEDADLTFAFVVNRISEVMQSYQFIFKAQDAFNAVDSIILQESEIDQYKFVSKAEVLNNELLYGGAVVAWAQSSGIAYYEQTITNL
jgi:8-oxo-dGTP pyrophosphatase MutT (NUDIX family)